ncbi:TMEM175 family protein [Actinoplanes sp. NPDC049681]|uniref:TMEM175 family protein n=1 Tax=Actinoplanes sp. NPDC049681 TaxID=3363905 RepID=UPI0037A79EBB
MDLAPPERATLPLEDLAEAGPSAVAAERLTFFGDAVIAIAITLLALELPLPLPHGGTNSEMLHEISRERGEYIAFLISFVVIGAHWSGHHRVFRHVNRIGGRLAPLTLLWLLMQIITPFATKVLGGDGAFQFRFILYASVQALAGILFMLMVRQVQTHHLYGPQTPPAMFANAYIGTGSLALGFLLSIPVAFFTQYAYDFWFGVPVLTAVVRRLVVSGRRGRTSPEAPRPAG